jgi:uncharacterized protein (UPF0335 family)
LTAGQTAPGWPAGGLVKPARLPYETWPGPSPKGAAEFERETMDQTDFSPTSDGSAAVSAEQLRNFVDRIERLEQDKAGIADDIKDCYAEAKSLGYDVKILRKVIALRKKKPNERREEEELLDIYLHALGDLA